MWCRRLRADGLLVRHCPDARILLLRFVTPQECTRASAAWTKVAKLLHETQHMHLPAARRAASLPRPCHAAARPCTCHKLAHLGRVGQDHTVNTSQLEVVLSHAREKASHEVVPGSSHTRGQLGQRRQLSRPGRRSAPTAPTAALECRCRRRRIHLRIHLAPLPQRQPVDDGRVKGMKLAIAHR